MREPQVDRTRRLAASSAEGPADVSRDGALPRTVDDLVDFGPWRWAQKAILGIICLAIVCDGFDNLALGLAVPQIAKSMLVTPHAFGAVFGAGFAGLTLGTVIGGPLGDRFGRKTILIVSILLFAIFTAGLVGAHDITLFAMLRFFAGLGMGGAVPNAAALTAESTPLWHRPLAVTLNAVSIIIGGMVAAAVAAFVLPVLGWRVLFGIAGGLPLFASMLIFAFVPESPKYLAHHPGKSARLARSLRKLGVTGAVTMPVVRAAGRKDRVGLLALFRPPLARETICLWAAFFCALTLGYLFLNWIPTMLMGAGFGVANASLGLLAYNVGGLTGALAAALLISRYGSRILVPFAIAGTLVAVVAMAFSNVAIFGPVVVFLILLLLGGCLTAVTSPLFAIGAHIYPTSFRSMGVAFAAAFGRLGAIGSSFLGAALSGLGAGSRVYFVTATILLTGSTMALLLMRRHIPANEAA